ncbi:MAG TPA: hypothetical protein VM388_07675 [Acidimicrobiales bacterium]|nr:hypothetical protein [Acidimicrobiales bacterium]HWI02538.1 hypothetical protein [Acidimicrobiales bacterium]
MRIAATCEHCGREFLLYQLYNTSPVTADRCPHCSAHLGIVGVARLAASADQALHALVQCLKEFSGRKPGFRIDAQSVLGPVTEAVGAFAGSGDRSKDGADRAA